MSKPAPQAAPKPSPFTPILFAIGAYLLYTHFAQGQQTNQPVYKDSAAILTEMRKIDAKDDKTVAEAQADNDLVVRQLLPSYNNKVKEDVDAKKLTVAQSEDLKTSAAILAAHIQVKEGVVTNDANKLRMAYNTLEPFVRTRSDQPDWTTTPVEVTDGGKTVSITGKDYLPQLISQISARNKTDLIWGVIPGGYQFIDFLVGLTGHNPNFSYAFATFLLALVVRGAVYPLSQKQLLMSRKMSQLTPRLKEIKENFAGDQLEMNKRSMELYSRYGINPFAGCLPAFVQLPLFYTIYQCILHYQFEFTKGYFLWINPAASQATHGILAPNLGQQDYVLIAIYSVTMIVSTLLTPVTDPTQAKQQRLIGVGASIMFPVMMCLHLWPVVSGFVLYWTFTNLFSMAQSIRAYRMPMPELVEVNAPGGGVFPGGSTKPKGRWAQMIEDAQRMAEEGQKGKSDDDGTGGSGVPAKPKAGGPKGGAFGAGKVSPSRPIGETGGDGNSKPKKKG